MFSDNAVVFFTSIHTNTPHISSEAPTQHASTWAAVAGFALVAMMVLLAAAIVESAIIWHQQRCYQYTAALIAPRLSPVQ